MPNPMKIMEKAIKATIQKIKKLGYKASYDCISDSNTCYINVFSNENNVMFILRMSDHDLCENNQLPAGVVNESYYYINRPIPTRFIRMEIEDVLSMSEKEYAHLWTNRYMVRDDIGLLIAEPFIS